MLGVGAGFASSFFASGAAAAGLSGAAAGFSCAKVHNFSEADYTDYKLGATKDVSGWLFGAALVGTNAKGKTGEPYGMFKANGSTYDAGKTTIVLSVGKTF